MKMKCGAIIFSVGFLSGVGLVAETNIESQKVRTAPDDYRFAATLDVQPENDRIIARIINVSSENQTLDMSTVHFRNIRLNAEKESEKPQKEEPAKVESAEVLCNPAGQYARFPNHIETDGYAEYRSSGDVCRSNSVILAPQTYLGMAMRSAGIPIFEPLQSAVFETAKGEFWTVRYALQAELPGRDGKPVTDPVIISPSYAPAYKPVHVTRDMINKFLNARRTIDLQEKSREAEAAPKDTDRFQVCLSLVPDKDTLMADVVCVNPKPGKDEQRTWPPWRKSIHMKTLYGTSWEWQAQLGDKMVSETPKMTESGENDYSKLGNYPKLGRGELVGRIVQFSNSPVFVAVKEFFDKNKAKTAKCVIRLKLKLYVPDNDGKPREAGEMISNGVVVTQQDYQMVCSLRAVDASIGVQLRREWEKAYEMAAEVGGDGFYGAYARLDRAIPYAISDKYRAQGRAMLAEVVKRYKDAKDPLVRQFSELAEIHIRISNENKDIYPLE